MRERIAMWAMCREEVVDEECDLEADDAEWTEKSTVLFGSEDRVVELESWLAFRGKFPVISSFFNSEQG